MASTPHDGLASPHASNTIPILVPLSCSPEIAVAFQCLGGQSFLTFVSASSISAWSLFNDTNNMHQTPAIVNLQAAFNNHETWFARVFTKTLVGTAEVQQMLPPDPSALCSCYKIHLAEFEYHWLLTEILRNPRITPENIGWSGNFGWQKKGLALDERVITLRSVLDKAKVARLLIIMLVISPSFGVVVGHFVQSAGAGLAVSAGIFALASFIQGLTAWVLG